MNRSTIPLRTSPIPKSCWGKPAFTLIELVVSLTISAMLVVGISAALTVGLQSAQPSRQVSGDIQASKLADRILSEIALAKRLNTTLDNEIEFTTPNQDGDAEDDNIRYQWSNDGSFRLRRSYNHGPLIPLEPPVHFFDLDYHFRSVVLPAAPAIETPEYLLIEHDSSPGGTLNTYATSLSNHCAQWFKPSLHPNAVSWKLTRVQVVMRKTFDSFSTFQVRLLAADPNTTWPTGPVLSSDTRLTSSLSQNFEWVEFNLPDVPGLAPEVGYCITIVPIVSGFQPRVQFETATQPQSPRGHWLTTSNGGGSWSSVNNLNNMRFRIFGTITVQNW